VTAWTGRSRRRSIGGRWWHETLTIEQHPDPRDVAALSDRLYEYNAGNHGHDDGLELAMFVRGDDGEIRGGL